MGWKVRRDRGLMRFRRCLRCHICHHCRRPLHAIARWRVASTTPVCDKFPGVEPSAQPFVLLQIRRANVGLATPEMARTSSSVVKKGPARIRIPYARGPAVPRRCRCVNLLHIRPS